MFRPPTATNEDGSSHPLYCNNMCKWPGCERVCEDFPAFLKHVSQHHSLDDRSVAQLRVQHTVVAQIEAQAQRERQLYFAMHAHLQSKNHSLHNIIKDEPNFLVNPTTGLITPNTSPTNGATQPPPPRSDASPDSTNNNQSCFEPPPPMIGSAGGPIKRRDKSGLPLASEIERNREYYQSSDVRPPYTYASLIRQAIMDHPDRQLTLNEIYNWFQKTFAYFRRNAATWKNAVRHNLSLHKCFIRMENVKGSVWTVDELEFQRRRLQRIGSKIEMTSSENNISSRMSTSPPFTGGVSPKHEPNQDYSVFGGEALNLTMRFSGSPPTMVDQDLTPVTPSDDSRNLPEESTNEEASPVDFSIDGDQSQATMDLSCRPSEGSNTEPTNLTNSLQPGDFTPEEDAAAGRSELTDSLLHSSLQIAQETC